MAAMSAPQSARSVGTDKFGVQAVRLTRSTRKRAARASCTLRSRKALGRCAAESLPAESLPAESLTQDSRAHRKTLAVTGIGPTPLAMTKPAYFVGPWDLNKELPCVPSSKDAGTVVLVESIAKGSALPYHRKKLVLVVSAMRHFAKELEDDGYEVSVVKAKSYVDGIRKHVESNRSSEVIAMQPREHGLQQALQKAKGDDTFGVPLTLHDDGGKGSHFFLPREEVRQWMADRKTIRMHHFYAFMRKRTGYLMNDGSPIGGKYSFDGDNRKTPKKNVRPKKRRATPPDAMTKEVMTEVAEWPGHWGEVDGFDWPVTRQEALAELDDFFAHYAEKFGAYQDAMLSDQAYMWHTRIGAALNLCLLSPREVCERIVKAHAKNEMPLNSAEGLLRQVLGGVSSFAASIGGGCRRCERLTFSRPSGLCRSSIGIRRRRNLRCLKESAAQVLETGYAHHIQRLMVLGNFALLTEVAPIELSHWFWAGFVDAYEWVQLPNVHGMALFADDTFTTKPYAASGSYIHRMSDYCGDCRYKVKERVGEEACPFNSLYWRFMANHRKRLEENPRVGMLFRTWDRFDDEEQKAILETAESFLKTLKPSNSDWEFNDDQC